MWDWLGLGRLFCHKYFFVIPKCVFVTILLKIWVKIVNTNGTQMLIFIQSLKLSKNIYLTNIVIFETDLGMKQEIRVAISLSSGRIKIISTLSCSVNLYSSLDKN